MGFGRVALIKEQQFLVIQKCRKNRGWIGGAFVKGRREQVKEHKSGVVTYEHQMFGAVIVHPELEEVIPLAPEPIQKQDGSSKNDCERNAARRLLAKIRCEHPHLKLIVVKDGLASNGPTCGT